MIKLKRVDEPREADNGIRFLVRLWPRGIKEEDLQMEAWLPELTPSDGLSRCFGHDPTKRRKFRRRYFAELKAKNACKRIRSACHGDVTLLYSARDEEHNNVFALRAYLESHSP